MDVLDRYGLRRERGNFWLSPVMSPGQTAEVFAPWGQGSIEDWFREYAQKTEAAFEEFIFSQLLKGERFQRSHFSMNFPLRVLAGDVRYWMHRLFRIAVSRSDELGIVEREDEEWDSMELLERKFYSRIPESERSNFQLTRPHYGSYFWDGDDEESRLDVLDELLEGNEFVESLDPVLELLASHHAHEDFSDQVSWVKEDFERAFYRKRSRVKVLLLETVDDRPVWDSTGGTDIFRDVMSFFDPKDRRLVIALRNGKSVSQIARELGHRGHAAVSRRLAKVKEELRRYLST
jgi:hypothetical protein